MNDKRSESKQSASAATGSERSRSTIYRSAVDLWVALMLLMTPAAAILFSAMLVRQGRAADAMTVFLVGAGLLLLTILCTFPCRYTILIDTLSIRCGVLCYQVPLSEIKQLEKSVSLRSGPALSLRRVLVATEKRKYLLSPKDREGFMAELQAAMERNDER